ncbi:MAG TPA: hypothetical protein VK936_07060 [Longimicrobiales bacterium]|nr:hypothetical protein [Longimicrobiales bacterium]
MARRAVPDAELYGLPMQVDCPFCAHADRTELHSPFGPQLSVATYWCNRCHTAFDFVKWSGDRGGSAPPTRGPREADGGA